MLTDSTLAMLREIVAGLRDGDDDVYRWLCEELRHCGGSDDSTRLAMGVIAQLLPRRAREDLDRASLRLRRAAH